MKRLESLLLCTFIFLLPISSTARTWYMAVDGSDKNPGTIQKPFATLPHAQAQMGRGDTLMIRGGKYHIDNYTGIHENIYAVIFEISKSGYSVLNPTCYFGYPGERPEFDLSGVKPQGYRVAGFYLLGDYIHLKNFDITGIQVTITTHTQSENIAVRQGNHDITIEDISIHDGMGIGVYITKGSDILVLNCDAYNNYDSVSEDGMGGNSDGFGSHCSAEYTGNVFRGCRAWCNSDDGFDLIGQRTSVTIENCWAFFNGYKDFKSITPGDGNGFKAGGYGKRPLQAPIDAPRHIIRNCLAYGNKSIGFYSNHHLGGNDWINNTALRNKYDYMMVNQISWDIAEDVAGYGHVLMNNIALTGDGRHYAAIDESKCTLVNNAIFTDDIQATPEDFENFTDFLQLTEPRKKDRSLPDITFLKLRKSSPLSSRQMGYQFKP